MAGSIKVFSMGKKDRWKKGRNKRFRERGSRPSWADERLAWKHNKEGRDKRQQWIKKAKEKAKEEIRTRSFLINYLSRAVGEHNQIETMLFERLTEMYSLYYPELKLDKDKYLEFVLDGKERKSSMGIDLSPEDLEAIRSVANTTLFIKQKKQELQAYMEKLMKALAPNVSEVATPAIAAQLISIAGSLEKLAVMPASTIQLLGAENALFTFLRNNKRGNPPKHGVIFNHPFVSMVKRSNKGKMARAVAAKIAIAAKADAYKGAYIADKLNAALQERFKELRE
ncbi:MAG: hypothetical protein QW035_03000 [Candidatus Anstonellales archaeon]